MSYSTVRRFESHVRFFDDSTSPFRVKVPSSLDLKDLRDAHALLLLGFVRMLSLTPKDLEHVQTYAQLSYHGVRASIFHNASPLQLSYGFAAPCHCLASFNTEFSTCMLGCKFSPSIITVLT